jgi:hypothetical protein
VIRKIGDAFKLVLSVNGSELKANAGQVIKRIDIHLVKRLRQNLYLLIRMTIVVFV